MYNLRYHLATIVSIFLSLALGLVLGAAIAGSDIVSDSSTDLVASLRKEFSDITTENDLLSSELAVESSFADQYMESWMTDRLSGANVLIITDASDDSTTTSASKAVSAAGANPIVLSLNLGETAFDTDAVKKALSDLVTEVDGEDYDTTVATAIAEEWSTEATSDLTTDQSLDTSASATASATETTVLVNRPVTQALIDAGLLTFSDGALDASSIDAVVDVAVLSDGSADQVGLALSLAFESLEKPAVVAAESTYEGNLLPSATDVGLSSQSGIEKNYGEYGVVALLTGAESGAYGPDEEEGSWFPALPLSSTIDLLGSDVSSLETSGTE